MNIQQVKALHTLATAAANGATTLPDTVVAALAATERVHTAATLADVDRFDLEEGLYAARAGIVAAPGPAAAATSAVQALLDQERAWRVKFLASEVLDQSAGAADLAALEVVQRDAAQLVTQHLQPALAATLDAVREALPGLAGREPTRLAMYGAPAKVVAAFEALERAASRYQVLRQCQEALRVCGYRPKPFSIEDADGNRRPGADMDGECAVASDALYGVWSNDDRGGLGGFKPGTAPWPDTEPARLAWLVAHDVPLWLPTVPQANEAVQRVHATLRGEYQAAAAKASGHGGTPRPRKAGAS